jgi:hypothetical protein
MKKFGQQYIKIIKTGFYISVAGRYDLEGRGGFLSGQSSKKRTFLMGKTSGISSD